MQMQKKISDWTFYCVPCDYWSASLAVNIESEDDDCFSEEGAISFLDDIRIRNFQIILDSLASLKLSNTKACKILDIGCATGLFLKVAADKGFQVVGIEPNPVMARIAMNQGLPVLNGYFPESIGLEEKFDVIIFNDVFEHLQDLNQILKSCHKSLHEDGLLIINIPSSKGFFFKLGGFIADLGMLGLWKRLWQTMFYTPHLHYFSPRSLDAFVKLEKFKGPIKSMELDTIGLSGLWKRVSVDNASSLPRKIVNYLALVVLLPIIQLFPRDTFFSIYKKNSPE